MSLDSKNTRDERDRAQAEEVFTGEGAPLDGAVETRRLASGGVTAAPPALAAIRRFRRGRWTLMEDLR